MSLPRSFKFLCSGLVLASVLTLSPVHAKLPVFVEGQPLPSLAPMVEKVSPAVVNIFTKSTVKVENNPLLNDPLFRQFFGDSLPQQQGERQAQSLGTGVIVDADKGYIVTNNHVVEDADEISVQLDDGRKFDAKLIGGDKKADVAVIQIEGADNLTAIAYADSDALRVGDFVVAVGNPFGLGHTVTSGIVSALGRSGLNIEEYENFIQTDASINPGNSGGALVDLNGNLVGINTAIIGRQGNVGIGFAIPINMVNNLSAQLIEFGEIKRGQLGVYIQDLDTDLAEALGTTITKGALVTQVIENTSADKAGIEAGDVITRLNDKVINNRSELRNYVGLIREGTEVEIEYVRGSKTNIIKTKILASDTVVMEEKDNSNSDTGVDKLRGATLSEITDSLESGVLVTAIKSGSPAEKSGLQSGDIITGINQSEVSSLKDAKSLLEKASGNVLLNIKRNGSALFIVLR